jgi:hypothetical protein
LRSSKTIILSDAYKVENIGYHLSCGYYFSALSKPTGIGAISPMRAWLEKRREIQ